MANWYLTSHGSICHRSSWACETYFLVVTIRHAALILAVLLKIRLLLTYMSLSHLLEVTNISRICIVSHCIVLFVCGSDLIDGKHYRHCFIVISEYAFHRAFPKDTSTTTDCPYLLGAVRITSSLAHHLSHGLVQHQVALHELSNVLRLIHHGWIATACVVIDWIFYWNSLRHKSKVSMSL